jgi:hypothetical protein
VFLTLTVTSNPYDVAWNFSTFNSALFSGGAWPFAPAQNGAIERIAILKFGAIFANLEVFGGGFGETYPTVGHTRVLGHQNKPYRARTRATAW